MLFVGWRTAGERKNGAPRLARSLRRCHSTICLSFGLGGTGERRAAVRREVDRYAAKPAGENEGIIACRILRPGPKPWCFLGRCSQDLNISRRAMLRHITRVENIEYWLLDPANSNHTRPCSGTAPPPPSPTRSGCRMMLIDYSI